jgi:large subunit ribosomal protein L17
MATSLLLHEKFETTVERAKDLKRVVEKLISSASEDTVAARRKAYSYLLDKEVVHKLFAEIGPRYKARPGGYTRVLRTRHRAGDAAELAIIELVAEEAKKGGKGKSKAKRKVKKAEAVEAEVAAE